MQIQELQHIHKKTIRIDILVQNYLMAELLMWKDGLRTCLCAVTEN